MPLLHHIIIMAEGREESGLGVRICCTLEWECLSSVTALLYIHSRIIISLTHAF